MEQVKIVIESLLTGSQFEIAMAKRDKVSMVKTNIQKVLGIPVNQQHLLHNQTELLDSMELQDIPVYEGIRLKLVLGMKVGPIQSARRVLPPLSDYDGWFDINDVVQNNKRDEPLTIKTKYLVYKGCKKNVHRLWKLSGEKGKSTTSSHNGKYVKSGNFFGSTSMSGRDDEKIKRVNDQALQDNIKTTEKMNQLRLKLELANARKKLKSLKCPNSKNKKPCTDLLNVSMNRKLLDMKRDSIEISDPTDNMEQQYYSRTMPELKIKQESLIPGAKLKENLTKESRMKIKENLSRNRSFKTIGNPPISPVDSSSSLSYFNNDLNPLELCFSGSPGTVNRLGRSLSFQSNYIFNRTDSNLCIKSTSGVNSLATMEAATISNSTPIIQEYVTPMCEPDRERTVGAKMKEAKKSAYSVSCQDLLLKEFLTKSSPNNVIKSRDYSSANIGYNSLSRNPSRECAFNDEETAIAKSTPGGEINEYFILPKLLIREDSSTVFDRPIEEMKTELLDVAGAKQPSTESLLEFYENLTSSSTSSLVSKLNDYSFQPSNRFYHSDLDLNHLNDRFKSKLSISNQDINTSDRNFDSDSVWSQSNLLISTINQSEEENSHNENLEEVNYDKFLNELLNNDTGTALPQTALMENEKSEEIESAKASQNDSEIIDIFNSDISTSVVKKTLSRRNPSAKSSEKLKLKSFGSNPTLLGHHSLSTHDSSNLTATTTTSTTTVHIPQLSRLDAIPTKYRRGYINLNDLSNSDLTNSTRTLENRRLSSRETKGYQRGNSLFHYKSHFQRNFDEGKDDLRNDSGASGTSGRQSRFEYCNGFYSSPNQCASSSQRSGAKTADIVTPRSEADETNNFEFQSDENLFNVNFDSFYEDFVDSAELSWSSMSSASSTSFESCSASSIYDKRYLILPEIKLDDESAPVDKKDDKNTSAESKEDEIKKQLESGKVRCASCNKRLGIIMIMKCHCNKFFCSTHRYKEAHDCTYDYKSEGKKKIERENPLCERDKLPKI